MSGNAYRERAERGEAQVGTGVTMIRTPAIDARVHVTAMLERARD
jgi:hypothetical protein